MVNNNRRLSLFLLIPVFILLEASAVFSQTRPIPTSYDAYLDAIHAPAAWANGFTGQGVQVGVVDDSFQTTHSYYSSQINSSLNYNFGSHSTGTANDPNPYWDYFEVNYYVGDVLVERYAGDQDCHGVAVAGCIGAYNAQAKVYGPAYNASLSGLRVDFYNQWTGDFDNAVAYQNDQFAIKNNSYGISNGYISIADNMDAVLDSIAVKKAAAESGVILNYSSGNERYRTYANGKDANKKGSQSNPYTLTIAATGDTSGGSLTYEKYSYFSNYGSNIFVTAPGLNVLSSDRDDPSGVRGEDTINHLVYYDQYKSYADAYNYTMVVDSDLYNGYNEGSSVKFSGTSASSPVASGVMALAVEALNANPNCPGSSLRAMKHLLVKTSQIIDDNEVSAADETVAWTTNAAGNRFSPTYGFGQIDAGALTQAASQCFEITPQTVGSAWWNEDGTHENVTSNELLMYIRYPKGALGSNALIELAKTDAASLDKWISVDPTSLEDYSHSVMFNDANPQNESLGANSKSENVARVHSSGLDSDAVHQALAATPVGTEQYNCFFTADDFSDIDIMVQPLEEVVLTIMASATDLNDMQLELTSPGGTTSILAFADSSGAAQSGGLYWSFTSNAFWGENPIGQWTLDMFDMAGNFDLELLSIGTTFYMGEMRVPEPAAWLALLVGIPGLWVLRRRKKK